MKMTIRIALEHIYSLDRELQNQAFTHLLEATVIPVDWAYDAWDELLAGLQHKDNHVRAIAAQLLCSFAKSDPEKRMLLAFPALLAVTKDERFVTARHCLQALWQVGAAGKAQQAVLVDGLRSRYFECTAEKNCTLIRFDIIRVLRNVYDAVLDESLRETALSLIAAEEDLKYRKKYATLWRK